MNRTRATRRERADAGFTRLAAAGAAGVVVVVAAALLFFGRSSGPAPGAETRQTPQDQVSLTEQARLNAGIKVEQAQVIERTDKLDAPAVLALDEQRTARIGSLVQGIVITTPADIGDRVKANGVLAEMHSEVVHEAWAGYRKAIADERRLTTELDYRQAAEERAKRLLADKAISANEVQRAQADRVAAEEELEMAKTEVRRAEEELQHLGVTNGDDPTGESGEQIPVRSPIAGVVLERLVTPSTAVTPGAPLFVVSDLSRLWAIVEIDETELQRVSNGRPVDIQVAAYPGERFEGKITFVGDVINPKTRRVTVRCSVPNTDGRLKPEMFAIASLGEGEPRRLVAVPSQAVHEMDQKMVVFVADAAGTFHRREVQVGSDVDGMIEIRSGLKAGERVATAGSFLLKSELLKSTMAEG